MMDLPIDVLVNKENLLPSDYYPKDLIIIDENENNFRHYQDPRLKPMVRSVIYPDLLRMMEGAKKAGLEFIVDSGYRSYNYQKQVLDRFLQEMGDDAYKRVALPGASEHQTGLAFDFAYYKDGVYSDDVKEDDEVAIWLANNSYKYGFVLRYPKGKEDITGYQYEPWHFRYVGLELAKELFLEGITLEEYYSRKESFIIER